MKKQLKKWEKKGLCISIGVIGFLVLACNVRLKTVFYTIETKKVNQPVRLALLTDLHAERYGKNQSTLIEAVRKQNPDILLLGGDIFDDKKAYKNAEITIKHLAQLYPCYYVTGNHEYWSSDITAILEIIASYGVTILSGECVTIEVNGQKINICGVDDPDVVYYVPEGVAMEEQLKKAETAAMTTGEETYTILLSHRPELYKTYQQYAFDLVLCGHAHGGQWRIPFLLNGLYAPHQGLFPEYAGGRYDYTTGTMIVSRGLSKTSPRIPRIFNRPELVIVDIY